MNTELTVSMDEALIEQARQYAQAHDTSVSELIRAYVSSLGKQSNDTPKISKITGTTMTYQEMLDKDPKPTPFTDSITGILKESDDGRDYKEIINEEREKRMAKYL